MSDNGNCVTLYSDEAKQNAIYPRTVLSAVSGINGQTWQQELDAKTNVTDIKDNLTSTDTNKPLSANQGKVLSELIGDCITKDTISQGTSKTFITASRGNVLFCFSSGTNYGIFLVRTGYIFGVVKPTTVNFEVSIDGQTVTVANNSTSTGLRTIWI